MFRRGLDANLRASGLGFDGIKGAAVGPKAWDGSIS